MLYVLTRCCRDTSLSRAWPCCEPFRWLVSLSEATSLNATQWTVSEMPDQSIKRTFCERKWLLMGTRGWFSTLFNLLLRRSFNVTFLQRSNLVVVLPVHKQCYYRSIFFIFFFAGECTLRREQRTETRERREIENERCLGGFSVKKTPKKTTTTKNPPERFVSEREMALTGTGELRPPFSQFPVFVRWSVLPFSRLSATEMASSSAVVWV